MSNTKTQENTKATGQDYIGLGQSKKQREVVDATNALFEFLSLMKGEEQTTTGKFRGLFVILQGIVVIFLGMVTFSGFYNGTLSYFSLKATGNRWLEYSAKAFKNSALYEAGKAKFLVPAAEKIVEMSLGQVDIFQAYWLVGFVILLAVFVLLLLFVTYRLRPDVSRHYGTYREEIETKNNKKIANKKLVWQIIRIVITSVITAYVVSSL